MPREGVRPETCQKDVLVEVQVLDLSLERVGELTAAHDDEARIGYGLDHAGGGVDQVPLALVGHQRRDVANDGGFVRKPELLVCAERGGSVDVFEVDALVDDRGPILWYSVSDQHRLNTAGRTNEELDLTILPPRQGVGANVKVDAARRYESRRREPTRHRPCQRRERDAVRVMRMEDRGPQLFDQARQLPGRSEVHLVAWRQRIQVGAFGHPPPQFAVRMGDQRGPMTSGPQTGHGQHDLVLSATPRAGRVNVKREHRGLHLEAHLSC